MSGEITEKNFIQHELIGLQVSVVESPDTSLNGITGIVVDETMNTFRIEYQTSEKRVSVTVPKHTTTFKFTIPETRNNNLKEPRTIEINGSILTKRPEDRIKKLAKFAKTKKKRRDNES